MIQYVLYSQSIDTNDISWYEWYRSLVGYGANIGLTADSNNQY